MNDDQLLRYSRHILLNELGIEGQQRLLASHALVIGAGGLGSPVALYLGTAGVGRITIIDHDTVDLTNLQRQIAHNLSRVGQPKANSAAQTIHAINPEVRVVALQERADALLLQELLGDVDVVVVCGPSGSGKSTLIKTVNALELRDPARRERGVRGSGQAARVGRCHRL